MNHDTLKHTAAALGSLTGYHLARIADLKSWYPYVVIGGIVGHIAADLILAATDNTEAYPENRQGTLAGIAQSLFPLHQTNP